MDLSMAAGLGNVLSGIISADSANQVAHIKADATAYIRGKNNEVVAAENARDSVLTGIARWRQSINNKRVVSNAAMDQEMLTVNYNRQRDARTRANFADQVQNAEAAGRLQAQAAASGVTGSVVDVLNMTLQMKKGQQDTAFAESTRQAASDEGRKEFTTYWANLDKLDTSLIFDTPRTLDQTVGYTQERPLFSNINVGDIKAIAQGAGNTFSFTSPSTSTLWGGDDFPTSKDQA